MKRSKYILIASLWASGAMAADITAKKCVVAFNTTGSPVLVKIDGKSTEECKGTMKIEGGKVVSSSFELNLDGLDTGIRLRNRHLKENYLKTNEFPKATFKINEASDIDAQLAGTFGKESPFKGELELKGKKGAIAGNYKVQGNTVTAQFDVELGDFDIEKPAFMGVKVVDKVHLTVTFEK